MYVGEIRHRETHEAGLTHTPEWLETSMINGIMLELLLLLREPPIDRPGGC